MAPARIKSVSTCIPRLRVGQQEDRYCDLRRVVGGLYEGRVVLYEEKMGRKVSCVVYEVRVGEEGWKESEHFRDTHFTTSITYHLPAIPYNTHPIIKLMHTR